MDVKKKILHLTFSLSLSGGPKSIMHIVDYLDGFEHWVAGVDKGNSYFCEIFRHKYKSYFIPISIKGIREFFSSLKSIIQGPKYDIVHFHGRGSLVFLPIIYIFNRKAKYYYTIHGFNLESIKSSIVKFIYINIEGFLTYFWDCLIFVSISEMRYFESNVRKINEDKFRVIPNFALNGQFVDKVGINHSLFNQNNDFEAPRLLYLGRIENHKGLDIILESLNLLINNGKLRFSIYFIGQGTNIAELKDFILSKKMENYVFFVGELPNAYHYMPFFDALVFPSRFEGCPNTIIEAMMSKLPVIVTPARGVIDMIDETNGYLSIDFQALNFAKSISLFLNDFHENKEIVKYKVERGFQKYMQEYTEIQYIERQVLAYNK